MLEPAFYHSRKLNSCLRAASKLEEYQYFFINDYDVYEYMFPNNDFESLHLASLDPDGRVIGYFACIFDRGCKKAYDLKALNFGCGPTLSFSKDLRKFFEGLFFEYGMNKIEWDVVVGNPAEAIYDRVVQKYGGKEVGVKHATCADKQGRLYDQKFYEVMKSEYVKRMPLTW